MTVLVTGSDGYLGRLCRRQLCGQGDESVGYDLPFDILDRDALKLRAESVRGHACLHLAAHKHAAYGEECPAEVAEVNILGTRNVVELFGPNVVLASTCKAADPMTAYGASKLIAERIVLNAGGRVVRLVNVWGSTGSVAEIWEQIPDPEPIPVVEGCERMWLTPATAASLLVGALRWPTGRYAPDMKRSMGMLELAATVYPTRTLSVLPLRRGDRPVERLLGEYEWSEEFRPGVQRICHPADALVPVAQSEAA